MSLFTATVKCLWCSGPLVHSGGGGAECGWSQRAGGGGGADLMERRLIMNSSTIVAAQPSRTEVTKWHRGKVISEISGLPAGICVTEEKKTSLSYLLIVFPFPIYCNEKRNEGRLFLTECFVNTVDFTGRADISGSWGGRRENESDQSETKWSVTRVGCDEEAVNNTLQIIIHPPPPPPPEDDYHPGTPDQRGRLSLIALRNGAWCLRPRGIFRKSLKTNQWVTLLQTHTLMTGIHQKHC